MGVISDGVYDKLEADLDAGIPTGHDKTATQSAWRTIGDAVEAGHLEDPSGGTNLTPIEDAIQTILKELDGYGTANTSRIQVSNPNGQSIANASWIEVKFITEEVDNRDEYSTSTGRFTAIENGTYAVSWKFTLTTSAWTATEILQTTLSKNQAIGTTPNTNWNSYQWACQASITRAPSVTGSAVVTIEAGDDLSIFAFHTQGAAVGVLNNTNKYITNFFHVAKIQ